jgi:asparagine synthase (glutamine-hydrolysing)
VRVPFMDHDVVEFCMSLPDARRVSLLRRKHLLKRASRGLVDDAIIAKKKRGFFHSALGAWLATNRDGLVRESLLDERARARGIVRPGAAIALMEAAGADGKKVDQRLFSLVLLERWQRLWTDADGPGRRLWRDARAASHVRS